jgi:putative effector of murein hydrolase LrgA (UPF0299 family)
MEIAVIGIGIVALIIVSKIVGWIVSTMGKLFIPTLVAVVVYLAVCSHLQIRTVLFICAVSFIATLLAVGGKK